MHIIRTHYLSSIYGLKLKTSNIFEVKICPYCNGYNYILDLLSFWSSNKIFGFESDLCQKLIIVFTC